MASEKRTFRTWEYSEIESPTKKIPKPKNSIITSDRAVQCEFLAPQPVELIKLNAENEELIYKNDGYYPRKQPEKSEARKKLTPLDNDCYIQESKCYIDIKSRRLDDPKPRRQSSRNRRPPKRFRSPPPPPSRAPNKPKNSDNSKEEPETKRNLIPEILISIRDIKAILSNDADFFHGAGFSDSREIRKRVKSKVDFSI